MTTKMPSLGDKVRMVLSCANYDAGQVGRLTRFDACGHAAFWWVDFGTERHGSTGCWVGRGEFEAAP